MVTTMAKEETMEQVTEEPKPENQPRKRPVDEQRLEKLTQEIGHRIFEKMDRHQKRLAGVEDRLMSLMMKDEDLRYRMLRFVDVYPALQNSKQISKHLEEYLKSEELNTGHPQTALSAMARTLGKSRVTTRGIIGWASRFGISRMGRQFIAGNTPEEVAEKIRKMETQGFLFSLDLLGEFVASESQADHFAGRYLEMIERFGDLLGPKPPALRRKRLEDAGPRVNISIKLSSLTSKFEPMDPEGTSEAVRTRLRPLFRAAKERGVFLNIDMEKYDYRDLTLEIILDLLDEEEFKGCDYIGTVIQAYLKDAADSLEWFIGELRKRNQEITIRLVKGAYWDSEQIWSRAKGWPIPVITEKPKTDAMYERCCRMLLENSDIIRTAIGSHNVRSIAHAMALRRVMRVPARRFECQMLYGMAGPIKDALQEMGMPVRIYVPCGELIPGMAYLVRRILENTSNESFLRQRFSEGVSEKKLLANPARQTPLDELLED